MSVKRFNNSLLFISAVLLAQCWGQTNLLTNPGFETGTTSGWTAFGCSLSAVTVPHSGSYSGLATVRSGSWGGPAQSLLGRISDGQTCSISGWARLQNASSATVKITIKQVDPGTKYHFIGQATVSDSGWAHIGGAFTLDVNETLTQLLMYFEGPDSSVNFYVDDVSVTVASDGDWETEANERIEQIRKGDFRIIAAAPDKPDVTIPDVNVQVVQTRHHFAFGSAINWRISNPDYAQFFREHFEWAVMENESKWYANEPTEGNVTYETADSIYSFCNTNNIKMRGHCIFWEAESVVQDWVKALSYAPLPATSELRTAVEDRLDSAVNHFKGKFLHWDVNNEMCNNSFFAGRLGYGIRPWMFQAANAIDPNCKLFLNDYNVINGGYNLSIYKQMAYDLAAQGAPIHGLGVQCHMTTGFNPATIKARFDSVAEVNLPIWVSEFDVSQPDVNVRADELEDFYRVAFSHPSVDGILMWGFWEDSHWRDDAYIVNSDWTLNAAGERYEAIMDEWTTEDSQVTDSNGVADLRGFYGTYEVNLSMPGATPTVRTIELIPDGPNEFIIEMDDLPNPTNCQQVQDYGYWLPGDLDGNCQIDYSDLAIMLQQWLSTEPAAMPPYYLPDIYVDDEVDLLDFDALAFDWLKCNIPGDSNCISNWQE